MGVDILWGAGIVLSLAGGLLLVALIVAILGGLLALLVKLAMALLDPAFWAFVGIMAAGGIALYGALATLNTVLAHWGP